MSKPSIFERARMSGKAGFDEFEPKPPQRTSEEKVTQAVEIATGLVDFNAFAVENLDPERAKVLLDIETIFDDTLAWLAGVTVPTNSGDWARDMLTLDLAILKGVILNTNAPAPSVRPPTPPMSWIRQQVYAVRNKYTVLLGAFPELLDCMDELRDRLSQLSDLNFAQMLLSYLFWHWPGGQWPNPLPDSIAPPDPGPGPGPGPDPGEVTFTLYNADPGNLDIVLSPCAYCYGHSPQVTAADFYDGNVDNGGHIDGPTYPIVAQLLFENPIVVSNVLIAHAPEGWCPAGSEGFGIDSHPTNWMYRGEVWGLRTDDVWIYLGTGITNGSGGASGTAVRFVLYEFAPDTYKGLRIVDLENDHPGAGWFPSEFGFNFTPPT